MGFVRKKKEIEKRKRIGRGGKEGENLLQGKKWRIKKRKSILLGFLEEEEVVGESRRKEGEG